MGVGVGVRVGVFVGVGVGVFVGVGVLVGVGVGVGVGIRPQARVAEARMRMGKMLRESLWYPFMCGLFSGCVKTSKEPALARPIDLDAFQHCIKGVSVRVPVFRRIDR